MSGKAVVAKPRAKPRKLDRRSVKTRDRLGDALIALMVEKPLDSVTVQEVLERAGISRSTFYAHFEDKNDLFLSDMEDFLETFSNALSRNHDKSERVFPVQELFAHVRDAHAIYSALVAANRLHDFLDLAQQHFARGIERRLTEIPRAAGIAPKQRAPLAQAHAGALVSLLTWWTHSRSQLTAAEMDELFHRTVWAAAPQQAPRAAAKSTRVRP